MKKFLTISLSLFVVLGASAQGKLSSRITDMLSDVNRQISEAQSNSQFKGGMMQVTDQCPVDTAAIKDQMVVSFNADGTVKTVDVLAELAEGATCPTALLESKGIKVDGGTEYFAFLTVPVEQLEFLETVPEFTELFANNVYHPNNDTSRQILNVSNINGIDNSTYTFDQPFTGKGVVVGIIDAGIKYNHRSFKNSDGTFRVKKVVDYNGGGENIVTAEADIAALTWDGDTGDDNSHGTHVACSAAGSPVASTIDYGSGSRSRNLMGMAPEADLVLCGLQSLYEKRILKSMQQIISTAQELNEPCVINMSFGTTDAAWHNGNTAYNENINKYAKKGVVFCMSSANDAGVAWTVDKTLAKGESVKIIPVKDGNVSSSSRIYHKNQTIGFFMPQCTNKNALTYSFEVVDSITGETTTLANAPLKTVTGAEYTPSISFSADDKNDYWIKGSMTLPKSYFAENSKFLVIKLENTTDEDVRVYAIAPSLGRNKNGIRISSLISTDIPNYTYDKGTADMSMNLACSAENIITVGAYAYNTRHFYYNKADFYSYNGTAHSYNNAVSDTHNSTATFSSYGRDDFGKMHPDVIAPGTAIVSAYNSYDTSKAIISTNTLSEFIGAYLKNDAGDYTDLWFVNNGTSMATPIVTGVVALWMQACAEYAPEYGGLDAADVREIIQNTSHTTIIEEGQEKPQPIVISSGNPIQMGYGVIDAEAGIKYIKEHFPTAISGVNANETKPTDIIKKLVGGKIVIEKNGKLYNTSGQQIF